MKHADFTPRLMKAPDAARYLGMSASKLRSLPIQPKKLDGLRLYDRFDLDEYASSLTVDGDEEENPCDEIFGVTS